MKDIIIIRVYDDHTDRDHVRNIWSKVFRYVDPHNDPDISIDRKLKFGDDLFFVAVLNDKAVGTVMAGYDGHRGWIYSMAVDPEHAGKRIGSMLLKHAEDVLTGMDCPKVNLQVMLNNSEVVEFYEKNGYKVEERISMGKKLYSQEK